MTAQRLLIVTVGVPGAGKSTVLDRAGHPIVSTSMIRQELAAGTGRQAHNDEVWETVHTRLRTIVATGSVVLDATNLVPEYRTPLLAIARETGAVPVVWRFVTPHHLARLRCQVVPDRVMDRMCAQFDTFCTVEALAAEGWVVRDMAPDIPPVPHLLETTR